MFSVFASGRRWSRRTRLLDDAVTLAQEIIASSLSLEHTRISHHLSTRNNRTPNVRKVRDSADDID